MRDPRSGDYRLTRGLRRLRLRWIGNLADSSAPRPRESKKGRISQGDDGRTGLGSYPSRTKQEAPAEIGEFARFRETCISRDSVDVALAPCSVRVVPESRSPEALVSRDAPRMDRSPLWPAIQRFVTARSFRRLNSRRVPPRAEHDRFGSMSCRRSSGGGKQRVIHGFGWSPNLLGERPQAMIFARRVKNAASGFTKGKGVPQQMGPSSKWVLPRSNAKRTRSRFTSRSRTPQASAS